MVVNFYRGTYVSAVALGAALLSIPAQAQDSAVEKFFKAVDFSGLVEVEATASSDYAGEDSTDVTLATVELGVEARVHKYVTANVLGLYEDDDSGDAFNLDEAFITLGNVEAGPPVYLQAGKWVMPFGDFDTSMSSDPLTLELAETKEVAVLVGAVLGNFTFEAYGFNGDTDEAGSEDHFDQFGVTARFDADLDGIGIGVAGGYLNNISDSDAISDALGASASMLDDYVGAFEARAYLSAGAVSLFGAYMRATDDFTMTELPFDGGGARPGAWHVEAALTCELFDRETVFAATWQGTQDALALELPEHRVGGAVTVALFDYTSLTAE